MITKPQYLLQAQELFPDVNVTIDGHKYLGSLIGNEESTKIFLLRNKSKEWAKDIDALAEIAESDPQLVYNAYVFGTSRRCQFVCRTTQGIADYLKIRN